MRQAYIQKDGLRVNSDGTTIRDRKPSLKLYSNHFKKPVAVKRIWFSGTAISDGRGWYKRPGR